MSFEWLSSHDSRRMIIRDLALTILGVIALGLAIWRSVIADRQSKTAQRQSETAQRQSETAQRQSETALRNVLNDRYHKANEMLSSEHLHARLGGIYALEQLMNEHPKDYQIQIMDLYTAFVRHPTEVEAKQTQTKLEMLHRVTNELPTKSIRQDVEEIMRIVGDRSQKGVKYEKRKKFFLYFRETKLQSVYLFKGFFADGDFYEADLSDSSLEKCDFSGALFLYSNLAKANLSKAILVKADFEGANLTKAILARADFEGANLASANLSGARFSDNGKRRARGLTQSQLDSACADVNSPPNLDGVLDADTGKQLVWRGSNFI